MYRDRQNQSELPRPPRTTNLHDIRNDKYDTALFSFTEILKTLEPTIIVKIHELDKATHTPHIIMDGRIGI